MPTGLRVPAELLMDVYVSILVLLDNAYRRYTFLGGDALEEFQSLFFWIMPTGPKRCNATSLEHRFQSLFFWIMPTGRWRLSWILSAPEVSILVLLDNAYRPNIVLPMIQGIIVSILVLLDNAYRPNIITGDVALILSFNPCSFG